MRHLRTLPLARLLLLITAVGVLAVGVAAVAVAAGGGRHQTPPPKSLANAIHDALGAPEPAGITARVTFTNNLLPSGALLGQAGSPLLSGASGRLWLTNDGRGRVELQSNAGDAQLVWSKTRASLYDASSNTAYEITLPTTQEQSKTPPTVAAISDFLTKLGEHFLVSAALPTNVAGQPAYDASLTPKDSGTLLGPLHVAWDANRGVPLRVAIYAAGHTTPALELKTTSISYGAVPSSAVDVSPPATAHVVDLGSPTAHGGGEPKTKPVAAFTVVAPDSLAGRTRTAVTVVDPHLALVHYGKGAASLLVAEHDGTSTSPLKMLPPVDLGVPAHELQTQLGTVVLWEQNGISFTLAGFVSAANAESAVRALVA